MAFWIYQRQDTTETVSFRRQRMIRLSGEEGIIAGFLRFHAQADSPWSWELPAGPLRQLATPGTGWKETEVVIELKDRTTGVYHLHRIVGLHGHSDTRDTDLVLTLCSLYQAKDRDALEAFEVPLPMDERRMLEALGLTGGLSGGTFHWCAPKMNIGAAIMPPAHRAPAPCA
ncbi:MAG: hypothetical protein E1N59_1830 [Puniceicoccaceae bacterium 5H]|nr:MAG: hypothetical protein E1N59_1830 [Puniceicoccaceae bacterium 5H]